MGTFDAVRGCFFAASLLLANPAHAGSIEVIGAAGASTAPAIPIGTSNDSIAGVAVEIFAINPTPSVVGQGYSISASALGGPNITGNITVSDGLATCTIPQPNSFSCQLVSTTAGAKTITANYVGNYPPASATAPHTVNKAATSLTVSNITVLVGQQFVVTPVFSVSAPGAGSPSGVVNIYVGGILRCSPSIGNSLQCPVTLFVDGEYPVYASYAGNANFLGTTSPVRTVTVNPKSCVPIDITLGTQAAVNSFQATYGPCAGVLGNFHISGSDITNLTPLIDLVRVGTDLRIQTNTSLTSLSGLGNIKFTGNQLRIENNPLLTSVGLNALNRVGTDLRIDNNASLTSLAGLAMVTQTGNQVRIQNNPLLASVGLNALTQVGTDLTIDNNGALTSLAGLARLTKTGNQLRIQNNGSLASLNGLQGFRSVGTDLTLSANPQLSGCTAIRRLVDAVDDALPGPGPGAGGVPDVGAQVVLGGNATGCNSKAEILFDAIFDGGFE